MGNGTSSPPVSPNVNKTDNAKGPGTRIRAKDLLAQRPSFKHMSRSESRALEREQREKEIAALAIERARQTLLAKQKREKKKEEEEEEEEEKRKLKERESVETRALGTKNAEKTSAESDLSKSRVGNEEHDLEVLDTHSGFSRENPEGWLAHVPSSSNLGGLLKKNRKLAINSHSKTSFSGANVTSFNDVLSAAQSRVTSMEKIVSTNAQNNEQNDVQSQYNDQNKSNMSSNKRAKHKKKLKKTATEKVLVDASQRHLDATPARPFAAISASERRDEERAGRRSVTVKEKMWTCAICQSSNKRRFVRCGTCQSGRDVTVATDLLRRVKKARKVVSHHLKRAKEQKKQGGAKDGNNEAFDAAKDVAKRWLVTAFATSIEVIAHKFICDGKTDEAVMLVCEHAKICESYWRFRTLWLGALNIVFSLAVVLGDHNLATTYAGQLHAAFCKFGQQTAMATTSWERKMTRSRGKRNPGPPPAASTLRSVLDSIRKMQPPSIQQADPQEGQRQTSSAEFFAAKFGSTPSDVTGTGRSLSNGAVPSLIHFRDVTAQETSEIMLQIVVYFMNLQALDHVLLSRSSSPTSTNYDQHNENHDGITMQLSCQSAELETHLESILIAAGLLVEEPGEWEVKRKSSANKIFVSPTDLTPFTANVLPCIRRRLLVLNEVYLSRGNVQFNMLTRTVLSAGKVSPRGSRPNSANGKQNPSSNIQNGMTEYTQSFLDKAAPLSAQLFSRICDGIAPERFITQLAPLLHSAVELRALSVVEVLIVGGHDPNDRDAEGYSALHCACVLTEQSEAVSKTLLDGRADPNAQDNESCTPLHYAASVPHNGALVALLLLHGADPMVEDSEGVTPGEYASATGDQEMILLLINGRKKVEIARHEQSLDSDVLEHIHSFHSQRSQSAPSGTSGGMGGTEEWIQCWDQASGYAFFQNTRTGETQWVASEDWKSEEKSWREDVGDTSIFSSVPVDKFNDGLSSSMDVTNNSAAEAVQADSVSNNAARDDNKNMKSHERQTSDTVDIFRKAVQGFANKAAKPFAMQMKRVLNVQEVALESKANLELMLKSMDEQKAKLVKEVDNVKINALKASIGDLEHAMQEKQKEYEDAQAKIRKQELKLGMQKALILKEKDKIVKSFTSSVRKMDDMLKVERSQHRANLLRKLQLRKKRHARAALRGGATSPKPDKNDPITKTPVQKISKSKGSKLVIVESTAPNAAVTKGSVWADLASITVNKAENMGK